ncbi:unnamed protein product [Eruca vesicaria subsp. sativa]|uniref:Uncharacterized protein n=1 Tax=Eruca vesicaria subsp. sativa TaxID=29727 RepID=A0ABC8IQY7_ERUVS|nr:unnamed protein product [Eruca vesicaria subsp. sativa]
MTSQNDSKGISGNSKGRDSISQGIEPLSSHFQGRDSTLVEAVILSDRYISGRFLLVNWFSQLLNWLMKQWKKLKMEITSKPTALDELNRAVIKLEMERLSLTNDTDKNSREGLNRIETELLLVKEKQA